MASEHPDEPGLLTTLNRVLGHLVSIVSNRLDLFAVELQEERSRLFAALGLAASVVVFSLLTLVMLTYAIVVAAGEEHRLAAAVVITLVYLVATLVAFWRLRVRLRNWSAFSATLSELRKDRAWIEGKETET